MKDIKKEQISELFGNFFFFAIKGLTKLLDIGFIKTYPSKDY